MLPKTADIVIIGAGVIGASIAYHLTKLGFKPLVLEKGRLAHGSSGACDGMVLLQSKKPGIHLELALQSVEIFKDLSRELEYDVAFRKTGGVLVIETQDEMAAMEKLVANLKQYGLDAELNGPDQSLEKEKALYPEIKGASFCVQDSLVNPIRLTLGFMQKAQKNGACLLTDTPVVDLIVSNNRLTGVKTPHGVVKTETVINACGSYAKDIGIMAGLDLPIKPRRGQLIVTEPLPPMLKRGLLSAKYVAAKFDPSLAAQKGQGVSMEQTEEGNFLIGSTREFVGFNKRTTLEAFRSIAKNACRIIPALKNVKAIRTFAGFRPYTPDGLPILGPVEAVKGIIMACGHEGDGIALSPVTGKIVAEFLDTNKLTNLLKHFAYERFGEFK